MAAQILEARLGEASLINTLFNNFGSLALGSDATPTHELAYLELRFLVISDSWSYAYMIARGQLDHRHVLKDCRPTCGSSDNMLSRIMVMSVLLRRSSTAVGLEGEAR